MDEARFGTHSKIGHGWFATGTRARVKVKLGFQNFYAYSAVEPKSGEAFSLLLPRVNTLMLNLFLSEMANFYGPDEIVIVMDGAGWHRSAKLDIPVTIKIVYLPPYSPELNPVERLWLDLKKKTIRNKIYDCLEKLEQAVATQINLMSPDQISRLCAVDWLN